MNIRHIAAAAVFAAGVFTIAAPAAAAEFSPAQKTEVGMIVHDYLLSNPEVIREAIEELEKREKILQTTMREKAVSKDSDKLFNSPNQAVVGNPEGDVTIVEFFDYNCGYCKQSLANVAKLIDQDPKVRVVLKDFAILGPDRPRPPRSPRRSASSSTARNSGSSIASCSACTAMSARRRPSRSRRISAPIWISSTAT